jgi:3-oxoacyl-[acyl-carrier-protein] synthase II
MKKRVVVTGMDIVSSIGIGLENFWSAAKQGANGINRIQSYDASPYPTQIAGEIVGFTLDAIPEYNKSKRYTRVVQYAMYCAHHALIRSGLTPTERLDAATFIGTSLGGYPETEMMYKTLYTDSWKKISPLTVIKAMPNSVANNIAIAFGLGGMNSTISNACVSSAEAIGNAYQQIAEGRLKVALCGGTESLIWEATMVAWCKLRVMSTNNDNPSTACRPFDQERDGMIMADGAGILILEELEHAKARSAKIYAEIIGFGSSCDASHITAPDTKGQKRAIIAALDSAKLTPQDIHYINAHGTATQLNDVIETATIKSVFGNHAYDIPITAQKSMTGHAIGAAGVMEIIATSLCLQEDILLPTINLKNPDAACDLDYVANQSRKKKIDIALSNHFAFGGANVVLVLSKYNR